MSCIDDLHLRNQFASWVDLVSTRAADGANRLVFRFVADGDDDISEITYGELDRAIRAVAAQIAQTARPGDRALLLHPPGLDYVIAFHACLYAGVIAVPAYPPRAKRGLGRLASIVSDAQPRIILSTTALVDQLAKFRDGTPFDHLPWLATDAANLHEADDWRSLSIHRDGVAMLQYTSGSTSTPKGVVLTHANLLHNSAVIHHRFGHSTDSVGVIWLPPYHDMGLIGGILQTIYFGGEVTLMPPVAVLQKPLRWLQWVSRARATTSGGPNFAYDLCVDKISPAERESLDLSSWRVAFSGAEPIHHETLDRFAKAFEPCGFRREAFYPCYGLAESALLVTGGDHRRRPRVFAFNAEQLRQGRVVAQQDFDDESAADLVGCGSPSSDTRIAIVDPETCLECDDDLVGEIWVAGPSVAAGYWGNRAASRQTFGGRLADTCEGPFLQTGDLGFVHEGELFITGRIKDVIIVRGRNYYPQDLERTAEASHESLRSHACAAFVTGTNGDRQIVIAAELERTAIRGRSAERIAQIERAIRSQVSEQHQLRVDRIVLLKPGGIPKTSSGKIQHFECSQRFLQGKLPVIEPGSDCSGRRVGTNGRSQPASPTDWRQRIASGESEKRSSAARDYLRQVLAEMFGPDASDLTDDEPLAGLGIDSLGAVELQNRVEQDLGRRLPLESLLDNASLSAVAAALLACEPVRTQAVSHGNGQPRQREFPLSFGQQALWYIDQSSTERAAYNVPVAAQITGDLNLGLFQQSLAELVDRHASLRMTFCLQNHQPMQRLESEPPLDFVAVDAARLSEDELQHCLAAEARHPFDLASGPLLRARLYRRDAETHLLLLVVHHIAVDFWSFQVLIRDLGEIYRELAAGRQPERPLSRPHYDDFVVWQRELVASDEGERQWKYWRKQLAGDLPVLELPTDHPRPRIQSYRGGEVEFSLDEDLFAQVDGLARRTGATPFAVLMSAYQVLLSRYSRQDEVIVGTPLAGRTRAELGQLVGYCTNPLPIRTRLAGDAPFDQVLANVARTVRGALEHQDFPVSQLVARLKPHRDVGQSTLFQTLFVLNRPHRLAGQLATGLKPGAVACELGGLQAEQIRLPHQFAMFDLVLMGQQTGAGLSLAFQYNADLFEPATIDDMAGQFRQLLRSIVACPSTPVGALSMLDEAQRRRTLHQSRSAEPASEAADPVHIQIAAQAARSPDAMAVIGIREGEQLTYRQLDEQSDQLAARLGKVVSKPDSTIAICLDRSPTMIVAVLGALKSGAAYLPLDPNIPQNRLQFQLEDAAPAAILTSGQLAERFDGAAMPVMWLDDAAYDGPPSPSKASGLKATAGGDLAYVMYTSGSTGRPKGVEIEHRALAGYTATAAKMFQLDPDDRVLQFAALAFDTAAEEIFPTLTRGATLVLRDEAMLGSAGAFFEACRRHAITVLDLPTAFWRQLVRQMEQQSLDPPAELRLVILGGERARRDCWEIWRRRVGDRVRLLNTYGPTEATIVSTVWDATTDEAPGREIPIGRPVAGAAAYILDNRGQLAAPGTPGELHLGGPGLARGYRNRPQLDAERFIPNPFTDAASPRLYRTGDLVRRLPCGELEFLGRTDGQIKLRGFRIEPGEIEAVLCEHSDVTEAAVIAHEDSSGRLQLAAYVGSTQASPPTVDMLRRHVRQKLPDYMTPTQWVVLGELPHTTSGKIDRPHLPRPTADRAASAVEYAAPRTPGEQALAHVWSRVLEIERVGVDDNFFDLGGDSLLAIQLAASAAEDGLPLTAGLVMQHQTIAAQAGALASGAGEFNSPATLVPIQPRGERSPLFVVHPTGGIVTPYYHLAHLLGEDQPVVGIQAQGVFDAQPPHQSVEAMAAHYVAALRASQAEGPYHLAGWSLGGLVALEMARQLRQAGCDVGLVALVDASPAGAAQTEEQVFGMLAASLPELALMDLADFELLPRDEQIAYFAQQITAAGMAPAEFAATHARRLFDVFEAHLQAGRDYRPQPYDGPLHAFVASESSTGSQATAFDWSPTASAAASEELPGNHWTLLREPAVSRLAARLTDLLAR